VNVNAHRPNLNMTRACPHDNPRQCAFVGCLLCSDVILEYCVRVDVTVGVGGVSVRVSACRRRVGACRCVSVRVGACRCVSVRVGACRCRCQCRCRCRRSSCAPTDTRGTQRIVWWGRYTHRHAPTPHRYASTRTDTHRHAPTRTDKHRHAPTYTDTHRHAPTRIDTHRHVPTRTNMYRLM